MIEVRSRLLELALQVQARIPQEPAPETIKEVSREASVSQVFRNAVYGNNNTIVVGGGSIQNVANSIVLNDVESLVGLFRLFFGRSPYVTFDHHFIC